MYTAVGRHPRLLSADSTLLMVVDVQESLLRVVREPDRLLANISILISAAKTLGLPVVVTEQNREKLGPTAPEVARLAGDSPVLDKMTFGCLDDEAIRRAVRAAGRGQVLVCGVEAHVCVSQTVLGLAHLGYQVHVAADAVSSREPGNKELALRRMQAADAIVSSTEMAVFEMLGRAGTPQFREILKLVR